MISQRCNRDWLCFSPLTAGFSPRILQKTDDQRCMALLMAGQGIHFIASGMECLEPTGLKHLAISGAALTLELAMV